MLRLQTTLKLIKREISTAEDKLERLRRAYGALAGRHINGTRRNLSAAAREKIAAAQRARWAKYKRKPKHAA